MRPSVLRSTSPGAHALSPELPKTVVVSWDLLRNTELGLADVDRVGAWCAGILAPVLGHAGVSLRQLTTRGQGGEFPTAAFVEACGEPVGPAAWERLFMRRTLPPAAEAILDRHLGGAFVVGVIPPWLAWHLERRGQPFLDLEIHPVRFLRDLFLRVRTNDGVLGSALAERQLGEGWLRRESGLVRGRIAWHGPRLDFRGAKRVGIFIGQVDVDASLLSGGRLRRPAEFLDGARAALQDCDEILVLPHPYGATVEHVEPVCAALGAAPLCGVNTYVLLNHPAVTRVVGLSSSVLHEAALFGKEATFLLDADFKDLSRWVKGSSPDLRVSVGDLLRSVAERFGAAGDDRDGGLQGFSLRESWSLDYSFALSGAEGFQPLDPGEAIDLAHRWPKRHCFTWGWSRADEHGTWKRPGLASLLLQSSELHRVELVLHTAQPQEVAFATRGRPAVSRSLAGDASVVLDVAPGASGLVELALRSPGALALRGIRWAG